MAGPSSSLTIWTLESGLIGMGSVQNSHRMGVEEAKRSNIEGRLGLFILVVNEARRLIRIEGYATFSACVEATWRTRRDKLGRTREWRKLTRSLNSCSTRGHRTKRKT